MEERPIGVFDSGVGGLSCIAPLIKKMPQEKIIFYGDSLRAPYGSRSKEEITAFSIQIADYLISRGCKALVIACNTISSIAGDAIRCKYPDISVVDIIKPGAKLIANSGQKQVAVLATAATVASRAHAKAVSALSGTEVIGKACPSFVPIIESGKTGTADSIDAVHKELDDLYKSVHRTFFLGCTHYPFIRTDIEQEFPDVNLLDPAEALADQVYETLKNLNLLGHGAPSFEFVSSDPTDAFNRFVQQVAGNVPYKITKHVIHGENNV